MQLARRRCLRYLCLAGYFCYQFKDSAQAAPQLVGQGPRKGWARTQSAGLDYLNILIEISMKLVLIIKDQEVMKIQENSPAGKTLVQAVNLAHRFTLQG
jgi:hypothetical protein